MKTKHPQSGSKSFRLFKDGRFYLTDDANFGCFESDLTYIGQAFLPDFGVEKLDTKSFDYQILKNVRDKK